MEFTPAQKTAIETKNCSLLVAAGAGSGKTRVLTERILDRLRDTEHPTDITRFLIVTFTTAAAGELAERIRASLTRQSADGASAEAFKNLALLPQAKICTIDAFCYDFVKEHFQKLGLPPRLRIAEETEIDVLLDETIGTLIEQAMASADKDSFFFTLYDSFSGRKSDAPFSETVKDLYRALVNLPSPRAYLDRVCEQYREIADADDVFSTSFGEKLRAYTVDTIRHAADGVNACLEGSEYDEEMYAKFEPLFSNDMEELNNLLSSVESSYEAAVTYFAGLKFGSCRASKLHAPEAPVVYERRKRHLEEVKNLKKPFFTASAALIRRCANDCFHLMCELRTLLLALDERMWEIKKAHGILSFSDVERLTLSLLYDDVSEARESELARNAARAFDELYIDEYQDINPVQDMIFRALSRKDAAGTECGRFLVGDAKQSIYGFRGANPAIFLDYRDSFAEADDESASRRRLFMSNNFRCAENIIAFTNSLFSRIMDGYDENEKLIFSRTETHPIDEPVHLLLCNTDFLPSHLAADRLAAEAQVVYDEIMRLLDDPEATSAEGTRYTLNDIAILTSKWDAARTLERFFAERGVPVICEKGESFFERQEIRLALNLLLTVDNPERDIPTAGVLRSPIGGFDDDELVKIRLSGRSLSLFGALRQYAESKDAEPVIKDKAERFLTLLAELRTLSRCCTASEFLRKMYARTDLPSICTAGLTGNLATLSAAARRKNLMLLYDKARDFDKTVFKGISAFLEYINTLKDGDTLKSCTDTAGEGIRIMTVHKSKGLEFPVCFLFNADRQKTVSTARYLMSEKHGIAFKLSGYANILSVGGENGFVTVDTPFRALLRLQTEQEERLEYKRLLYVALTRAKDRLYITASPDKYEKTLALAADDPQYTVQAGADFLDWILGYAAELPPFASLAAAPDEQRTVCFSRADGRVIFDIRTVICREKDVEEEPLPEHTAAVPESVLPSASESQPDPVLLESIRRSVQARRACVQQLVAVPPKLTVSLLKEGLIDYEDAEFATVMERKVQESPAFITENDVQTAAEKGTAMHMFMQFADFAACERGGCSAEADRLAAEGFLDERQRALLDCERLDAFFSTPLYRTIRSAKHVYRELRFNLKVPASDVLAHVPATEDFVLVQGVIDCFIENENGSYTVIDFKTDRVSRENGETLLKERYARQLAFYCRAVQDMTKKTVCQAVIFSFHLMKEIPLAPADFM